MSEPLERDMKLNPLLFHLASGVDPTVLDAWLKEKGLVVPDDLRRFWERHGGGELFQSETVLSPTGDAALGDDVDGRNEHHRTLGMPTRFLVFQEGVFLSALDLVRGDYVELDLDGYAVKGRYRTFDDWYVDLVRKEFEWQYGLPSPTV